jgi:hypothetical protein
MKYAILLISLLFLGLFSCQDLSDHPDISGQESKISISHFDREFFAMDSASFDFDLQQLKIKFPLFFASNQNNKTLRARFDDKLIRELYEAVDSTFFELESIENELEKAFKYFDYYFSHDSLHIHTWCSNFESIEPITISFNTILIGLDMYLGENSKFYSTAPLYIRQQFNRQYILPDVFFYYFSAYVPLPNENTLLASMIHYGKIHYLKTLVLPEYDEATIMNYSTDKHLWAQLNEANVWGFFLENNLQFSTQQQNKRRFIDDAPFSKFNTSFDADSPGAIGQWVGLQVVSSYMKSNPNITPLQLIKEIDTQKILRKSRYKPKNK